MRCFSIRKRRNNLPWYKCFQFLLGASACVQQHLYQEGITWCQKGLAVSFDECRKSQYYLFGDSFHLITHVKKRKVIGSHMLLTLINKRIQETGRLVMKTANNRNYLKQHWVQTFTWMIILIISALTIIHIRSQTTQNSYRNLSLKSKLCNSSLSCPITGVKILLLATLAVSLPAPVTASMRSQAHIYM